MSRIIKILSTEEPIKLLDVDELNATTVSGAKLVRLVNTHATATRLLTLKDGEDTIGTITIAAQTEIYIKKKTTDTLEESGDADDVLAVEIAFT